MNRSYCNLDEMAKKTVKDTWDKECPLSFNIPLSLTS